MKFLITALLSTAICSSAFAAETANPPRDAKSQEMMQKIIAAGTPGESHKILSDQVGEWNFTSKSWNSADDKKPMESTGTASFKMIPINVNNH